jgi:hypothetical protein
MTTRAYFVRHGEQFLATELTRGPWESSLQHAGPACALVARAVEAAAPGLHVARLTFDLVRPLPVGAALSVQVTPGRAGRKVSGLEATVRCEGREMVLARALLFRQAEVPVPAAALPMLPPPDACERWEFPFFRDDVGYHRSMELRRVSGTFGGGHMTVWFRMTCAVVEGEVPSALQRLAATADSGNGVSVALDLARYTFVNPDLTIALRRPPEGEWFALEARTLLGEGGAGLADTQLHDGRGVLGRSVQTLLVEGRPGSA